VTDPGSTDSGSATPEAADRGLEPGRRFEFAHRLRERLPVDAGRIAGHPFVRVGRGSRRSRPLVVIPGLNDPLTRVTDTPLFAATAMAYCARYAGIGGREGSRRVYMVSRPADRRAETTREMAAGYAAVLREIGPDRGPADLLGLSMGGFVAGEIAVAYPHSVGRLVFGLAAARLSDEGRGTVARWGRWADGGNWLPIYREAIDAVSVGGKRRALRIVAHGYDALTDGPRCPEAFRTEVRACLSHDGTRGLKRIEAPTLVIGADADPFFSPRGYKQTARALPEGSLRLFSGIGHQAVLERRRAFDAAVRAHLASTGGQ